MSTPVVLLHPLGVDRRFWDPVREALPDGFGPVLTPDLLGHGRSPLPGPGCGVDEFADAVAAGLGDQDRVHLVGVSLGSLVAQVVAARAPSLVDRLVLADGVAVYPEAMRSMWRQRAGDVRALGLDVVVEPMEALWFSPGFRAGAPERVAVVRTQLLENDPEGYARTCEVLAAADTTGLVRAIAAPSLVVCGKEDAPPFRAAAEWLAGHLPDARAAWLSGQHATAYEHPEEFAGVLVDFLG